MTDRLAVVTGGTKGLGGEVTIALVKRGYQVIALYRSDQQAALALTARVAEVSGQVECRRCDITRESLVLPPRSAFREIALVHAAVAPFQPRPLHLLPADDLQAQWEVAAKGLLTCALPLLRQLAQLRRGTVVTISSTTTMGPEAPSRGFAAYASAKVAMEMLSRGLAREYGPRGLRTFSVAPGYMDSTLTQAWPALLREAAAGSGVCDAAAVAERICSLIEDQTIPARGEEYLIQP
jgi:NAD(P)-dependent dehydrogenase (short-subunit alcohol dehydrogenase family)